MTRIFAAYRSPTVSKMNGGDMNPGIDAEFLLGYTLLTEESELPGPIKWGSL
jgi:hypothetical protein